MRGGITRHTFNKSRGNRTNIKLYGRLTRWSCCFFYREITGRHLMETADNLTDISIKGEVARQIKNERGDNWTDI